MRGLSGREEGAPGAGRRAEYPAVRTASNRKGILRGTEGVTATSKAGGVEKVPKAGEPTSEEVGSP